MTETLLAVAHRTLEEASASPPMRAAAAEAMLVFLREGIVLRREATRSLWRWLVTMPSTIPWNAADVIGRVDDEEVRASALAAFQDEESGHELRRLAGDVLGGEGHVQHLQDDVLLDLVERARSADDVSIVSPRVDREVPRRGAARAVRRRLRTGALSDATR